MIILSAALDLVGPEIPKGVVLLADVVPSFVTKLVAPYFIHLVPYSIRVCIFVALSVWGMLMIALTPPYTDSSTIASKLSGVILASLSSGGGELSFLGLTHYYGPFSLAAWGSGTGAAGLIGAGMYALATTTFGLSVRGTLLFSACLPAVMLVSFFLILPLGPLRQSSRSRTEYEPVPESDEPIGNSHISRRQSRESEWQEREGLLGPPVHLAVDHKLSNRVMQGWSRFRGNLNRAKSLFFPL